MSERFYQLCEFKSMLYTVFYSAAEAIFEQNSFRCSEGFPEQELYFPKITKHKDFNVTLKNITHTKKAEVSYSVSPDLSLDEDAILTSDIKWYLTKEQTTEATEFCVIIALNAIVDYSQKKIEKLEERIKNKSYTFQQITDELYYLDLMYRDNTIVKDKGMTFMNSDEEALAKKVEEIITQHLKKMFEE